MAQSTIRRIIVAVFPALCIIACSPDSVQTDDEMAAVGTAVLTSAEVRDALPAGLSPDDSARFVKAYVNSWIDSRLISEIASREVDMEDIDRLTDDYRSQLIMQQYCRRMFEAHAASLPDDSLRAYYDNHRTDFTLERPLVKGVYLKVPDDAKNLRILRKLYRSDRPNDIDRLEKEVLSSAIHYDYFRDRWVEWEQIETRVPADFGADPTSWLNPGKRNGQTLDISAGGFTYLLRITDVLPTGAPMPYPTAKPLIVQRMLASQRRAYEAELLRDLRERATADGSLRTIVK